MGTKDARSDAYIAKAAGFAKPMLTHLEGQRRNWKHERR